MILQRRRTGPLALAAAGFVCLCGGCVVTRPVALVKLASGDLALSRQQVDVALAEFRDAVTLDPHFAEGHYKLGLTRSN